MRRNRRLILAVMMLAVGCSQRPAPPPRPSVSPSRAASAAISLYDMNQDGVLDISELMKSPTLRIAISEIDADKNGKVTSAEIANHIRSWQRSNEILLPASPRIIFKGAPLAGATVTLVPAPFLGTGYPNVSAVTDSKGKARFTGSDRRYPGVYAGLYEVRVSMIKDGKELIPARYNRDSELALEVSQASWLEGLFATYFLDAQ